MKTFVITVSKTFPATHKRKGEVTCFKEKILATLGFDYDYTKKIHTIRANYPLWKKRIDQVQAGEAILSIRYWSGKPYNSKQVEICQLGKDDGVGVQKLEFYGNCFGCPYIYEANEIVNHAGDIDELAKNDGLSYSDFGGWFKGYDLSEPMAIIHFTKFRY